MTPVTIKKLENSEIEITGEISSADLEKNRRKAEEKINNAISIDGFRPGKVPPAVLREKVGDMAILEEMAEIALANAYPQIIKEHELEVLGRPAITLTKLAKDNPLGFVIKTAVMPEVTLPDYKKLAKEVMNEKEESTETSPEEVEKVVTEIQNLRKKDDAQAPDIDDEFVKQLGNFEGVEDFKTKIAANIKLEKEIKLRDKKRVQLLEKIQEGTTTSLPEVLIASELARMIAEFRAEIEQAGLTLEDYLTKQNKTEEEMMKELRPAAEKRVRFELILKKIGRAENLEVNEDDLEKESEKIMTQYKGADPERVGLYVEGMLMNEKVLQFLEGQK